MKTNRQKRSKNKGFAEIFGSHAVYAALQNSQRIHQKLFVSQNQSENLDNNINKLVPDINELHNKEMFKMFGSDSNHQGIVLRTSKLVQPSLDEILLKYKNLKSDIIIMLDQVTDPNNIGSIMRSCALFNCHSIIVSNDNAPDITATMAKAASGALEKINYISVVNLSRAIIQLKKNNYWIYGLDSNKKSQLKDKKNLELPSKCVLVFGSEGKGLRNLTKQECDELITIPITKDLKYNIDSLNVANACSITLYEHFRNFS
ncbi:23S rRNA (guanosine(2251)-2'-O)-methyltransferase RlmB [Alphaproteobacteria bacterium]|nr:23S rRNA (guanosine(2251)-2'-O)-methyltransferase RlmB [Alphaproteobacteria bacterium]